FRSSLPRLLHRRNTRYGWVASPYPTGTLTLQDAPSFSQRDNVASFFLLKSVFSGFPGKGCP
ncbi:MAG: hypothetical protein ACREYE_12025, partial [Gammaproteobacteria bacterium]